MRVAPDIIVMGAEHTLIQVGQVLDKYELLERVGQGGMAIVYRGLDRSLKRTVAVKILHKHLSDYQEARDRFEREAQAVAKLRHENILEIFDYSAKVDEESYIVTEFIDGQTLKQFITERPIAFPEVGAMIMLQVCRALAHAHAGGVLHRDIKPENIMIRSDGVVKLMDFGISHMVDLERLTVTGQLLGSPAYMAPEHVEGRPLDFRTDVFAVGIVLYQLTVGKLPFEGKNPHEVLKRIAECKFVDPRQVNPRIGNRLGRIILRAMAAAPVDRYPAIGEMVVALDAYLEESGLPADKIPGELARYFQAPASYEQALKDRLLDHLTRRGQKLLDDDNQSGALDVFDRVLTIDPKNEKVLAILDRINRRARMKTGALVVLAAVAITGGAYAIHVRMQVAPEPPLVDVPLRAHTASGTHVAYVEAAPVPDAAVVIAPADAGRMVAMTADAHLEQAIDAAPPMIPPVPIEVRAFVGSKYRVDGGPWQPIDNDHFVINIDRPINVEVQNACCQDVALALDRNSPRSQPISQQFLPGRVNPTCAAKDVSVSIDGKPWSLGSIDKPASFPVQFEKNAMESTKKVTVTFTTKDRIDTQTITVTAGKSTEVTCALH